MGLAAPGIRDRPLHPATAGHVLDFIILFLGPLGRADIYFRRGTSLTLDCSANPSRYFRVVSGLGELEIMVRDNPSVGNYEELGDLYMDDGRLLLARAAFDKAIAARADTLDPFYRRGVCAILLGDAAAALPDLKRAVDEDPEYDFHRAAGLLAHAYAQTGQKETAEALFRQTTITSTLSETYLNFADLLASEGRNTEARAWAQKVLDKKPTMPDYLRRRERPWFRSAREMLKRLPG